MYRIGLSSDSKPLAESLFAAYRAAGIGVMEISCSKEQCEALDLSQLRKWADEYGVELWSFHLPFMPFEVIDVSHPDLCRWSVSYLSEMIRKVGAAGIKRCILHASAEPIADEDRPTRMACAKESLCKLADIAAQSGVTIAVEDLPRSCLGRDSREILELTSVDDRLRVCLDTNHLLRKDEDLPAFIRAVGKKIITTHISDYDFINERHWLPGEGTVDWSAVLDALEEIGYEGVWQYEIGFCNTNRITRVRDLTCEDFVRNANELFARKTPTVIPCTWKISE